MAQRSRGAAAGARAAGRTRARPDRADAVRGAGPDLRAMRARLTALVEPIVTDAGMDLEELLVSRAGRRHVVRVVVDGDGGVGHDELSDLSRRISTELDAAEESDPASGLDEVESYTLEVTSPGVDRPLTQPRHWRRNVGRLVKVKAGDRMLTGRVIEADEAAVTLEVDGRVETIAVDALGPGRVQVEFSRLAGLAEEDFGEEIADDDVTGTDDGANDDGANDDGANDDGANDDGERDDSDQREEGEDGA